VVQQYFDALNGGHAQAALALLANPPSDTSLLTDQVLDFMLTGSPTPFTVIKLTALGGSPSPTPGTSTLVRASYTVGGQAVDSETMPLIWDSAGWKIVNGTVLIGINRPIGLAMTVNGVTAPSGTTSLTLFPGVYQLDSGNPLVSPTDGPVSFIVAHLFPNPSTVLPPVDFSSIGLTDAGTDAVRQAATAKVAACLDTWVGQQPYNPSDGCPVELPGALSGGSATTNRAWQYASAHFDGITATMESGSMFAQWQASPGIAITLTGTYQNQPLSGSLAITSMRLDLSDPANIAVTLNVALR